MSSWHSYPKIYNLGHAAISDLLDGFVTVEEKVDGSQFSFGLIDNELRIRSKGQEMLIDAPEAMFKKAADVVKELAPNLEPGWTYRAEYLQAPKHNTLCYDRTPKKHLIIFDISPGQEVYLTHSAKVQEADRLGLECAPLLRPYGPLTDIEEIKRLLELTSCLGGQKLEGVVVKNYSRFGADKKVLMGKHVSEAFKEVHSKEWRLSNPLPADIVHELICKYRTPARWQKAVQHLREKGLLEGSPRDIGQLMLEAQADLVAECIDEIKADLFNFAIKKLQRGVVRGLPEWYKEQLLEKQFAPDAEPTP